MTRALAAGVVVISALTFAACKDKKAAAPAPSAPPGPSAATPSPGSAALKPEAARPSLPTPVPPPVGATISVEDAAKVLPAISSKEILPLKPTSDGRQVHATWCMDGSGAEDVARQVGQLMAKAGYTALSIRGDAKKAGVQGDHDGFRMSMVVSASSAANCPAPQHYFASATIFRP
jgi:hypothetical protein